MSDNFGCVANTIKTFSGRYFDLADPLPAMVDGRDIARGLSLTCRHWLVTTTSSRFRSLRRFGTWSTPGSS